MKAPLDVGENLKTAWETFTKYPVPLIVGLLLASVVSVFTLGICAGPMTVGYAKMVLAASKGKQVDIGDVFKGFEVFVPSLALMLVTGLAIMLGLVLFVLPGLLAALFLMWGSWLMADGEHGVGACIKGSIDIVKSNLVDCLIFVLVLGAINGVASLIPFATLVAGPLTALMMASGYQRLARAPKLAAVA